MKMKNKNFSDERKLTGQTDLKEKCENFVEDQIVFLTTSTPTKLNKRKSVSLLDVSEIESALEKTKINVSSDTIGSSSSICKDSGYNRSESSLSSDKGKTDVDFLKEKLYRVMEDLKFKDVMISTLHESNHSLRMKMAEAENKITELRLKSESHCRCCVLHTRDSVQSKNVEGVASFFKYSISPMTRSEPNLVIPSLTSSHAVAEINTSSPLSDQLNRSPISPPTEDSYLKVQQWQSSFRECNNKLSNQRPKSISEPHQVEPQQIYIRSVPEALPQTMSYMETSRALAETYRKRQETPSNLYSFQMMGDHSVSFSPLELVQGHRVTNEQTTSISRHEESKSSVKEGNPREVNERLPSRQSILNNILFRNQELLRRNTIFDTFPLLRFQTHSLNARSRGLSDCLNEANEFAATLADGLSKLPNNLDDVRSISSKIK